jgi:flagellin
MALKINTSVDAASASRHMGISHSRLSQTLGQLASGKRINTGADDAAGLAISEILTSQVRGANQSVRNAQDGISLIQTADGALSQTGDALQRIRELTVQAGNGTLSPQQRQSIASEITQLQQGIDRTANTTQFNNQQLLDGSKPSVQLQTGPNGGANETTTVNLPNATTTALGAGPAQVDVSTPAAANASLANVDAAIDRVSSARAELGAQNNALEHATASLNVASENQVSARSRIRDLDYARGAADQARDQILSQLSTAVLAHANLNSQSVLRLLG